MKILWFCNTPCGATEKLTGQKVTGGGWLYALSESFCQYKDHQLHIAFYWHQEIAPFMDKGIIYHPVKRDGYSSKLGRYIYRLKQQFSKDLDQAEICKLIKVIDKVNPDLIHIHGTEENFGLIADHISKIPVAISIQGLLSPYLYKLYSGLPKSAVVKNQGILSKLLIDGFEAKERSMRKRSYREQYILKHINNIIGRTSWDKDCTLALNPKRKYFVCNEILRAQFLNSEWKNSYNGKIVLVTTISFGLYKGLEMIFETARILTLQCIDFEWNIIGTDYKNQYETLVEQITSIDPLKVNIKFWGRKNAEEMVSIMNQSDVFVQVSHIENSPNSLCEAMVLGMPVIASFAGGTSSLLEDGKEGVLVQDGDPYRLAGAIIDLNNNYQTALDMGQKARTKAMQRHDPNNVIKELFDIYTTLCKK